MSQYPYHNEPTHDEGPAVLNVAGNATRDTAISAAEGRLVIDMADGIFLLDSTVTPFTTLLTSVGKNLQGDTWKGVGIQTKVVTNPEFSELEDAFGGRFAKVSGTYAASGAITITVNGAGASTAFIFTPGDVILNATTGEHMKVATVASSTTITVASADRAFGTTAAAAGADGNSLFIVGNANEENSFARNANSTRSTKLSNYTQIFRTTFAVSGTENEVELYGGADLPMQRAKKGVEHARDIERAFIWGEKKYSTSGTQGKPLRATGGVIEFIQTQGAYVQNQGGALTAPDLNVFLREGFLWGSSSRKILMCGGLVLTAISEIARGALRMRTEETSYGMVINEWQTPSGSVSIVHNPLFVEDYAGMAILIDIEGFKYAALRNRATKLKMGIQPNDQDGEVDEYITECGLERRGAARNALLLGVV